MNCLVWNCLGLGNLCTGKKLGDIIWAKDPSVVFIAETLADEARLDTMQINIDFDIYIYIYIKKKRVVPKVGRGGGLVLFLKSSVNLVVVGSLHSYMLVLGHMWNLLRTYVI